MKTFISMFTALILGAVVTTTPANAIPIGKAFLHGISSPAELANKVQSSLEKNQQGTSIIDPERCKNDGSCAKPLDYLEMFQKSDPEAHLTNVSQIPDFLRKLTVVAAPTGEYWLACLKPSGKGYKPVLHCLSRSFKPGEKAWVDPKTNRIVLASDCTNPVEKPVSPKATCVEIHFFVKNETVSRFALLGPEAVNEEDDCLALKRVGELEFERWWKDECAVTGCDFSEDAQVIGQPVQVVGSIKLEPGEYVLRLPAFVAESRSKYVTVLCFDRGTAHSDGMGVRWFDYSFVHPSLIKSATVWNKKSEVPAGAPQLYIPWGEWEEAH